MPPELKAFHNVPSNFILILFSLTTMQNNLILPT